MFLFLAFLAAATVVSGVLSAVAARHRLRRKREPSVGITFGVTLFTLALMVFAVFQTDLFQWRRWTDGGTKGFPLWFAVPAYSLLLFPFIVVPSALVVNIYRKKAFR